MYKLLYPSIRVRTVHPVSVRVRVRLVLVLLFCALKLITINECIAQGAPSFEFVCRRKYSEWAIVNDSLGLKNNIKDWP